MRVRRDIIPPRDILSRDLRLGNADFEIRGECEGIVWREIHFRIRAHCGLIALLRLCGIAPEEMLDANCAI
jgi:hypothetical protein